VGAHCAAHKPRSRSAHGARTGAAWVVCLHARDLAAGTYHKRGTIQARCNDGDFATGGGGTYYGADDE
jgi:hypothetical protein